MQAQQQAVPVAPPPAAVESPCAQWTNIARKMGPGDTVGTATGQRMTRNDCAVQALTIDPASPQAWFVLGRSLVVGTAVIGSVGYTRVQCFTQALACSPHAQDAPLWFCLGNAIASGSFAHIHAYEYSKLACYVTALNADPVGIPEAWNNLATVLSPASSVTVCGVARRKADCLVQALELVPSYADAWFNLGVILHGGGGNGAVVRGVNYTAQACFVQALSANESIIDAWRGLAETLVGGATVMLLGATYNVASCMGRVSRGY
jgi:hypothetical protein